MSITSPQNSQSPSDKRYFPRWHLNNKATYALENENAPHIARTRDLSCSGVCLSVNESILPHQHIRLKINLADESVIRLQGQIVWVRPKADANELGIVFYNTDDVAQDLILQHAFEFNRKEVVNHWFRGWETP